MSDDEREKLINSKTTQQTNNLLKVIAKIRKTVNSLPSGEEYNHIALTDPKMKKRVKKCNKRLATALKSLMVKTTREKDNHEEFNALTSQTLLKSYHCVVDTADDLMETSNKNIDRYIKQKEKSDVYLKEVEKAFQLKNDSELGHGQKDSAVIKQTINYLKKPQLNFNPLPDNTYYQFVPLIKTKPNALTPLDPKIIEIQSKYLEYISKNPNITYDPDRNIKYEQIPHPYTSEITSLDFNWDKMLTQISNLAPKLPSDVDSIPYKYIDSESDLKILADNLSKVAEMAVDLEYHSYRSYQGFTCLMQITTRGLLQNDNEGEEHKDGDNSECKNYIVDTIELRSHMHILNTVFTDPKIVKVFHGGKQDIQWLQKDFGIYVVNMFDTGAAARILGMKASLQYLLKHYCDVNADKKYQLADWRLRPLSTEMLKYAREDTHYLLYIYDKIRKDLTDSKGKISDPVTFLKSVIKTSKEICLQIYQKPKAKDAEYFAIVQRNVTLMGEGQLKILEMLLTWRDYVSRVEDESVKFVMPNNVMFDIAKSVPKDLNELEAVLKRHSRQTNHGLIYKYEKDLVKRINKLYSEHSKVIEKRVNTKHQMKHRAESSSSSSSSSDDEDEPMKPVPQSRPKPTFIPISLSNFKVEVCPSKVQSQLFPSSPGTQTSENAQNLPKTAMAISKLIGAEMPQKAQAEPNNENMEQDDEQPQDPDQMAECADIVTKVEEIDVSAITTKKSKSGDSKMDIATLPDSISKKYGVKKGKRGKGKNKQNQNEAKRQKLGENEGANKETLMTKAAEITRQNKEDYSNEVQNEQKPTMSQKKRSKKQQIKDNLKGFNEYEEPANPKDLTNKLVPNPETWRNKLQAAEAVVGKQIDRLVKSKRGSYKKRGQKDAKINIDVDRPNNRFDFLDDDSDSS